MLFRSGLCHQIVTVDCHNSWVRKSAYRCKVEPYGNAIGTCCQAGLSSVFPLIYHPDAFNYLQSYWAGSRFYDDGVYDHLSASIWLMTCSYSRLDNDTGGPFPFTSPHAFYQGSCGSNTTSCGGIALGPFFDNQTSLSAQSTPTLYTQVLIGASWLVTVDEYP